MRAMLESRAAKRGQGQGGFTLIELLVVIAILAVLAGVVVFAVGGIQNDSQDTACQIDERIVLTARGAYLAENPGGTATDALIAPYLEGGASQYYNIVAGEVAAISGNPGGCT